MAPNSFDAQSPSWDEAYSGDAKVSPTKLLSLAIQKRRELYEARGERDYRKELLHGSMIRVLCKHLGSESRSANRRNRQRRRKRRHQSKAVVWNSWDEQGSDCSSGCESEEDLIFNGNGNSITSSTDHHLFDYPHPIEHMSSANSGIQTSLSAAGGPSPSVLDQLVPSERGVTVVGQQECVIGEPLRKRLKVDEPRAESGEADEDILGLRELFAITQCGGATEQEADWAQVEGRSVE